MRLYTFTNFMLSSVQQGIQPAHVIGELVNNYLPTSNLWLASQRLEEWMSDHKTMICLNGGNLANIISINELLQQIGSILHLPTAPFYEDEASLGGIMTSTGIVVPAHIYELASEMRSSSKVENITTDPELMLIDLLNSHRLAS